MNDTNTATTEKQSSVSYILQDGEPGQQYCIAHVEIDQCSLTIACQRRSITFSFEDVEIADSSLVDRYGNLRMKAVVFKWPKGAKRIEIRSGFRYGAKELAGDVREWRQKELKG